MQIHLSNGRKINTEKDLTAAERHIVQKLYAWQSVVNSTEAFQEKIRKAFDSGWNNSGPVIRRDIMQQIVADLEKAVISRVKQT